MLERLELEPIYVPRHSEDPRDVLAHFPDDNADSFVDDDDFHALANV